MGKEAERDVTVSVYPTTGVDTPTHRLTWGNDVVETRRKGWSKTRIRESCRHWMSTCHRWITEFCPFLLRMFTAKKQWLALFLFLSGAAAPLVVLGTFTPPLNHPFGSWPPFYNVFADKYLDCGDLFNSRPAGSVIEGFRGLFVLDATWGRFSFSTAKTIDVAWDILVGRSVQLLASWVAYIVFSDGLLRVIERHPASFRIFQRIALEGPGLHSIWTLCKELLSVKSKRTKALFTYMILSTSYVLCIPMFLGAMTGYDSTSTSWIDVDGTNNIVPTYYLVSSWAITGTWNSTFDQVACVNEYGRDQQVQYFFDRMSQCSCQMPNGTLAGPGTFDAPTDDGLLRPGEYYPTKGTPCFFNYPGSNETYDIRVWDGTYQTVSNITHNCNKTETMEVNKRQYDIQTLNGTIAYCYGGKAYDYSALQGKARCLPDTTNPTYQWGFSTMLSGIFVFIHFGWAVSMYIVWLDAQSRSTLIKEGYQMTPLRAAFAIAEAVKHKTGLGERQLVRHNTKDLNKELDGTRKAEGTKIEYSMFALCDEEDVEDGKVRRRRKALALDGVAS